MIRKEFVIKGDFKTHQDKTGDITISAKRHDGRHRHDIAKVFFGNTQQEREECLANSYFIQESFNVFTQTNKTPKELADANKELLYALKEITSAVVSGKARTENEVANAMDLINTFDNEPS